MDSPVTVGALPVRPGGVRVGVGQDGGNVLLRRSGRPESGGLTARIRRGREISIFLGEVDRC